MRIKANSNMGGLFFVYKVDKRRRKTKLRIGIATGAGNAWATNEGIIGTENEGKCIEEV
jgi:hypothetical protein